MRFPNLRDWLSWQEGLHPQAIDLSLGRVRRAAVWMGIEKPPFTVVSVAGTNGKGSCIAYLEKLFLEAGFRVGAYTSPHLCHYNERVRLDGADVSDDALVAAFTHVDEARRDTLTYFEFGTLAAMDIFCTAAIDIGLLEVGLGGRLDAVNVFDADLAVITQVAIDHEDWLGAGRNAIGLEKAGILRAGRPAVCGDARPPATIAEAAANLGSRLYSADVEYSFIDHASGWDWHGPEMKLEGLARPRSGGKEQLYNASAALMAAELLRDSHPFSQDNARQAIAAAWLPGRMQCIPGRVEWLFDVAHNVAAAEALAEFLEQRVRVPTTAVFGVMSDKDANGIAAALAPMVDRWIAVAPDNPRSLSAGDLAAVIGSVTKAEIVTADNVEQGLSCAAEVADDGDRITVFGSFYLVGPALTWHAVYCNR